MRVSAVVPAAGVGKRFGGRISKLLVPVAGEPLFVHTLKQLKRSFRFTEMWLAVQAGQKKRIRSLLNRRGLKDIKIVSGGKTRAESVYNAVREISAGSDWVLVHDAARPLVSKDLIRGVLGAAKLTGASICGVPATATVRKIDPSTGVALSTEDRDRLILVQTPQVFKKELLLECYRDLGDKAFSRTDEAALFDGTNVRVKVVPGESRNVKITTRDDVELFKFYRKRVRK